MSGVLSIDEVGPCRQQLKIEVPAPAVEAETRRVVEEFRRKTRLPGFRKGKVPRELVEQRFDDAGSWIRPPRPVDAQIYDKQVSEGLDDCLDNVPAKQRMAFILREVEGFTTEEICKILEVTRTNLGVLFHRVRNRLRECLEAKGLGA